MLMFKRPIHIIN